MDASVVNTPSSQDRAAGELPARREIGPVRAAVIPFPGTEFGIGFARNGSQLLLCKGKETIARRENLLKSGLESLDCSKLRQIILQIGYPAADRCDARGRKFAAWNSQCGGQLGQIYIEHQGTVHHQPILPDPFGIARAFAAVHQDVVAAALFSVNTQLPERIDDEVQVLRIIPVQVTRTAHDGIIQVVQVVIYGPATRYPPRQDDVFLGQVIQIDFGKGILVKADNNRRPVLPQIEHGLVQWKLFQDKLVKRHVPVWIGGQIGQKMHLLFSFLDKGTE